MSEEPLAKELINRIKNALATIDEAEDLPNLYSMDILLGSLRRTLGGTDVPPPPPVPAVGFGDLIRVKNSAVPNAVYRVEGLQLWSNEGEIRIKMQEVRPA